MEGDEVFPVWEAAVHHWFRTVVVTASAGFDHEAAEGEAESELTSFLNELPLLVEIAMPEIEIESEDSEESDES